MKHVYGYELVQEAVIDARRNAVRNGIQNATFIQGDLNKLTDEFGKDFPRPDVVITGTVLMILAFVSTASFLFNLVSVLLVD